MQMAMTERDKKLIFMLAIIVIVVSIGYWGIRPAIKAMIEAKEDIAEQEEIKELNDIKIAQIPTLQSRTKEYEAEVDKISEEYLPYMNSDEIDKMFTGMVLERGLFAYDLDIQLENVPASLMPYAYSKMATDPYYNQTSEEEEEEEVGALAALEREATGATPEEETEENYNDVVYKAHLVLRIGGDLDELHKFIDDMEAYDKKILITGYRWNESTSLSREDVEEGGNAAMPLLTGEAEEETEPTDEETVTEEAATEEGEGNISLISGHDAEGNYEVLSERILTLELDVFMFKPAEEE